MKNILITGGAGFIGSQLGRRLGELGLNVTLVDNMSDGYEDNITFEGKRLPNFVEMDVRNNQFISLTKDIDCICHFAATSALPKCQADPVAAYDNNVTGLVNVLEAARNCGVKRVIFSSTSAVYENSNKDVYAESEGVHPDLIYSSTKHTGENICRSYSETYGMDIIVTRFFNVYGEHQDIRRPIPPFIGYLAREVYFNRRPTLYNNQDIKRDYVNSSDVLECLYLMITSKKKYSAEIFNICSGEGYSVPDIVKIYEDVAGVKIDPIYDDPSKFWDKFDFLYNGPCPFPRERMIKEVYKKSVGSPVKTQEEFGFMPKVTFENGLKKVYNYCQKQFNLS